MKPDCHTCFTLGHSTRTLDEFCGLLEENQIERLVDVRRYPGSRRYPHFNAGPLEETLGQRAIAYQHVPELGGRRKPDPNSLNSFWHSDSFRGYADYLRTAEFQTGYAQLLENISLGRTVIICAEAVPWRCHRQLISDLLATQGIQVMHILATGRRDVHQLNSHAQRTIDGGLVYVASDADDSAGHDSEKH